MARPRRQGAGDQSARRRSKPTRRCILATLYQAPEGASRSAKEPARSRGLGESGQEPQPKGSLSRDSSGPLPRQGQTEGDGPDLLRIVGHAGLWHTLAVPTFEIVGRGPTGRRRRRTFRAIDEATARTFAEAEQTTIESVAELAAPTAQEGLRREANALGLDLPTSASRLEAVVGILQALAERCHVAEISFREDGAPFGRVEPYSLRRSKQGVRVRVFLLEPEELPDIIGADDIEGWHLYLVEEITSLRDTGEVFAPRAWEADEG